MLLLLCSQVAVSVLISVFIPPSIIPIAAETIHGIIAIRWMEIKRSQPSLKWLGGFYMRGIRLTTKPLLRFVSDLFYPISSWKLKLWKSRLGAQTWWDGAIDSTIWFLSPQEHELRKILLTRYFGNQKLLSKSELGGGNSSSGVFVKPSSGGTENPQINPADTEIPAEEAKAADITTNCFQGVVLLRKCWFNFNLVTVNVYSKTCKYWGFLFEMCKEEVPNSKTKKRVWALSMISCS